MCCVGIDARTKRSHTMATCLDNEIDYQSRCVAIFVMVQVESNKPMWKIRQL